MSAFRGLPSSADIAGFIMGGATPEQRAFLDRRTDEITAGARGVFEEDLRDIFESAGGTSRALAGVTGLGGDYAGVPIREATRTAARAAAEFGRGGLDVRAGLGERIGGGLLSVNQQAMGNLLGVGQLLSGTRGQAGQFLGAASDIGARELGMLRNFRLATGEQVGTNRSTQTTKERDPWGTAMNLGQFALGTTALLGAGAGIGPFSGLAAGGSPGTSLNFSLGAQPQIQSQPSSYTFPKYSGY